MLTQSQISEMATVKYPDTDESPAKNIRQAMRRNAYIAAFTDAMELMSKEWVSVSDKTTRPVNGKRYDIYTKQGKILPAIYERGYFHRWVDSNSVDRVHAIYYTSVTHYRDLPEPPVLTKYKKI